MYFQCSNSQIVECVSKWADQGKIVIVAALDANAERKPFGSVCELVARAEKVNKLSAICKNCPEEASFTLKHSGNFDEETDVGGLEKYVPVCRQCFILLQEQFHPPKVAIPIAATPKVAIPTPTPPSETTTDSKHDLTSPSEISEDSIFGEERPLVSPNSSGLSTPLSESVSQVEIQKSDIFTGPILKSIQPTTITAADPNSTPISDKKLGESSTNSAESTEGKPRACEFTPSSPGVQKENFPPSAPGSNKKKSKVERSPRKPTASEEGRDVPTLACN